MALCFGRQFLSASVFSSENGHFHILFIQCRDTVRALCSLLMSEGRPQHPYQPQCAPASSGIRTSYYNHVLDVVVKVQINMRPGVCRAIWFWVWCPMLIYCWDPQACVLCMHFEHLPFLSIVTSSAHLPDLISYFTVSGQLWVCKTNNQS